MIRFAQTQPVRCCRWRASDQKVELTEVLQVGGRSAPLALYFRAAAGLLETS